MGELLRFADLKPSTPITIELDNGSIELSAVDVINLIEPKAPPAEALKFLLMCRAARLNPLLGEAYLVHMPNSKGNQWARIIAKQGFLKRAQNHPLYDGHESGTVVRPVDTRTRPPTPTGEEDRDVVGTIRPPGTVVVGGWAKVHVKGRTRPVYKRVSFEEFGREGGLWSKMPCNQIEKVALVHAIGEAFSIRDALDESEVDPELLRAARARGEKAVTARVVPQAPAALEKPVAAPEGGVRPQVMDSPVVGEQATTYGQVERIRQLVGEVGVSDYQLNTWLSERDAASVEDLNSWDADTLIRRLEEIRSRDDFARQIGMDGDADAGPGQAEVATGEAAQVEDANPDDHTIPDVPRRPHPEPKPKGKGKANGGQAVPSGDPSASVAEPATK